jgi:hypothetical protein
LLQQQRRRSRFDTAAAAAVAAAMEAEGAGSSSANAASLAFRELGESVTWAELVALGSGGPSSTAPETIWEAIVLAGLPTVGVVGTTILVIGLVSSIGMQAMVCHTVGVGLMRSTMLMAPGAAASATAATAGLADSSAEEVVAQAATVRDAGLSEAVLAGNPAAVAAVSLISPFVATPLLSLTATLFWLLAVFRELRHASESAFALAVLPRRATQLVWSGDTLVLMSISLQRLCFVGAVLLVRLCVALALLVVGSPRLLGARSPVELLICVPALGFALEIPRRMAGGWKIRISGRGLRQWGREANESG